MMQLVLVTALCLFGIGVHGVLAQRDIRRILISVSIMLASISLLLVALVQATFVSPAIYYSFILFVWAVEIVEIIVAVALFLYVARSNKTDINELQQLKW